MAILELIHAFRDSEAFGRRSAFISTKTLQAPRGLDKNGDSR